MHQRKSSQKVWLASVFIIFSLLGCSSGSSSQSGDQTLASSNSIAGQGDRYLIGVGIYDITGPAAGVGMTGFGESDQYSSGISMRLWARTFIVADPDDTTRRVVFVNCDTWGLCQAVKQEIARRLAADAELSAYYSNDNVCLSATHSHSAITGYSHYFIYDVPTQGFIQDSFDAVVEGILQSIKRAHANLRPGKIYFAEGRLENVGWNRSVTAYNNDPAAERATYGENTDKAMTLLKFVGFDAQGREVDLGMLNWYAVHPTSIGPSNYLISSDNKGHAEYMFEQHKGADYTDPHTFVGAFAQTNAGDVTGNVPFTAYKYDHDIVVRTLQAYGITDTEAEITRQGFPWAEAKGEADIEENIVLKMMATLQYRKALDLYASASEALHGSVDYRHEFVDMRTLAVAAAGCATCASGMGASTTFGSPSDNPTPYPLFSEGVTWDSVNAPDWNNSTDIQNTILAYLLPGIEGLIWPASLSSEYIECQGVKPVILPTGLMSFNLIKMIPLHPQVLPIQVLKIGNLVIAAQPTEITTMAGRRVRETLLAQFDPAMIDHAVVAGLSNTYASYLATAEEYAKQGYEGAFTLHGPRQLEAFQQEYTKLCQAILAGTSVDPGTEPTDLRAYQLDWSTHMQYDELPDGTSYGQVLSHPNQTYAIGEKVSATFQGANPRNNLHTMGTFMTVERVDASGNVIVRRDWDPDTKFMWERGIGRTSTATMVWNTSNADPGRYVIRYYGDAKSQDGTITSFQGVSREFVLQ